MPKQQYHSVLQELAEVQQEGASVVQLLQQRQAGLASTLGQHFPEMRTTIWKSESSVQAAAQTLTPQMTENKKKVRAVHGLPWGEWLTLFWLDLVGMKCIACGFLLDQEARLWVA